ncbi:MAG: hypothetical protein IT577_15220 [Verrucomicrobiae bacterium]|nr:hypothetical protein [Verrucomicrobiae bacterium]
MDRTRTTPCGSPAAGATETRGIAHEATWHGCHLRAALPLALLLQISAALPLPSATLYVWTNSPSDGPGTNWTSAFHTIQAAVDAAFDGDTVLVTNGYYDTGGALTPGYGLSNRVCVTNAIVLRSVNGPDTTLIMGAADPATGGLGSNAVRCAYVAGAATVSGFTLTNGHTWPESMQFPDTKAPNRLAGGAFLSDGALVTNCVLAVNRCGEVGAGAYLTNGARAANSSLIGNRAEGRGSIGGAYCSVGCSIDDCLVASNYAFVAIGGVYCQGRLNRCTITENNAGGLYIAPLGVANHCNISRNANPTASRFGGGATIAGVLEGSILIGNTSKSGGGAICRAGGMMRNCQVVSNHSSEVNFGSVKSNGGGGAYCEAGATLLNCTLVANTSMGTGGGTYAKDGSTQINCVAYGNLAQETGSNMFTQGSAAAILNTCSPDLAHGVDGNITNAPLFADSAGGDFRLLPDSPCIDAGTNIQDVAADLNGIPRPLDGDNDGTAVADMGCHEYIHPGADSDRDDLIDADEIDIHRTDPLNPNSDGDPQSDGREVVADTDPNDRGSFFHILAFDADGGGLCTLTLPCSTARVYSVEWSDDLLGWSPVAGMIDLPGEAGGLMSLSISNAAERAFFRATVGMP